MRKAVNSFKYDLKKGFMAHNNAQVQSCRLLSVKENACWRNFQTQPMTTQQAGLVVTLLNNAKILVSRCEPYSRREGTVRRT